MQILAGDSIVNINLSGAPVASASRVIIFLHGWGRAMDDFNELKNRMAEQMPNTAFLQMDLLGFGGSPLHQEKGLSLDDYCAVLRDLMDKIGISRAALVGHSLGGRIGIKFAAQYPNRVEKLVLISAAGIPAQSFRITLLALGRTFFNTIFYALRGFSLILRLKNLLGAIFGSRDYHISRGALRETLKKVLGEDLRSDAARISAPALLIWGSRDQITPLRDGEEYHALIKGSRLEILSGGHFVFLEKPEPCADAIALFLQDR
ncbi:MAG: alpha/beta hydrolase [Candidatus Sungiibacteriota bacterium]